MPNQTATQKNGQLFYVMGASGVGKDSLLLYARQAMGDSPVLFAHRYITREVELLGENHIQLTPLEFENRLQNHCFKFHWTSHNLSYGIGKEVDHWLNQGLNVVMNGSRSFLSSAIEQHPDLIPVLIQVDAHLLRDRLINRGRENLAQIEKRIQRAEDFADISSPNLQVIHNNSLLSEAGESLISLLKGSL